MAKIFLYDYVSLIFGWVSSNIKVAEHWYFISCLVFGSLNRELTSDITVRARREDRNSTSCLLTYDEEKLHDGVEDVTVVRLVSLLLILSEYLYGQPCAVH